MLHHGTLRKYTASLLDLFNGLEVQHNDSLGNTHVRSVPITYSSKEKSTILDGFTAEQLSTGNYNVLPRANLSFSTMTKSDSRTMNKNMKINTKSNPETFEYMWNSVPYEFTFELSIICRGMNEASQIIEQIAPKFNPVLAIDVWDAENLNEPTRIPVKLLDIGIEIEEYDEFSSNLTVVSVGLGLTGSFYPPINTVERIREFKMNINEQFDDKFSKKIITDWDVDDSGTLINEISTQVTDTTSFAPVITDIVSVNPVLVGSNALTVIYEDRDNTLTEMQFTWTVIQGTALIIDNLDTATLEITSGGVVEIQVQVTDAFGNFATLNKTYNV